MVDRYRALPEVGVGVVYISGLEPLLAKSPGLIDVLEVEPQTRWIENPERRGVIEARSEVDQHIVGLPGRKLVHSIGTPVGGSAETLAAQLPLLQQAVRKLAAPFASEHLAFNVTPDFFTGFFLPPRQTDAGMEIYKQAILRLQDALAVPLAVETGVNYLRPRTDEIPDGEFVAELVESADCGILLDLHNIYCNQLNGRQSMEKFLSQIPLDRVWEIHLAGGFELNGFWLDAHSGKVPEPLLKMCRDVVPHLSNLKALIFEIFPSFLQAFGLQAVENELEKLHSLWELRGRVPSPISTISHSASTGANHAAGASCSTGFSNRPSPSTMESRALPAAAVMDSGPSVQEWEQSLGRMVIGATPRSALEQSLAEDPGIPLIQELIHEFRASMVVNVYRLTSRLLMLALTPEVFRGLLQHYWSLFAPQQYASCEADGFFSFLVSKDLRLPWFHKVLEFERAAMLTLCDGQPRRVRFSADPLPVLRALAEGRLAQVISREGDYEIEVKPEGPITVSGVGLDLSLPLINPQIRDLR